MHTMLLLNVIVTSYLFAEMVMRNLGFWWKKKYSLEILVHFTYITITINFNNDMILYDEGEYTV